MQIRTEHLLKRFGDVTAVNDLTVTLADGKLVALLGPSGCGKTTILSMLSGILPVTGGKVFFNDRDVTDLAPDKRNVGLVFQNYALYPHMTVMQNICFPMEIKRVPKAERIKRANELAEMVHITPLLKRKPAELSGGQQQRVAIARALAKQPDILLLDEPLSNLDAKLRVEMREEIRRIQRQAKITTVFVTHDQEEASSIADQVVLLKTGVLQQQDTARNLYDQPCNLFVADFLGNPPINKMAGVIHDGRFVFEGSDSAIALEQDKMPPEGTKTVLAIRAESVIAVPDRPQLSAAVVERYTLGKDELVRLQVGTQQMRAYVAGDTPAQPGGQLAIALKKTGVFLFDAASGERYL